MMNINWESVDESLTYFSRLTVTNGILKIYPQKRHHIKALMQWSRSLLMMGNDPQVMIFLYGSGPEVDQPGQDSGKLLEVLVGSIHPNQAPYFPCYCLVE